MFLGQHQDFIPHESQIVLEIICHFCEGSLIGINIQVGQQGIAGGDCQLFAALFPKSYGKTGVDGVKIGLFFVGPVTVFSAGDMQQHFGKAAFLREPHIVDTCVAIKINKFEIDLVFFFFGTLRNEADDLSGNGNGIAVFQYADALISLDDVEFIHIFIGLDRIANTIGEMSIQKCRPLCRKFCLCVQQGHEIRCKGGASGSCVSTDDPFCRYLHESEICYGFDVGCLNRLLQNRKIGILSAKQADAIFSNTGFLCAFIIIYRHRDLLFLTNTCILNISQKIPCLSTPDCNS